jgi:hypothetical protein
MVITQLQIGKNYSAAFNQSLFWPTFTTEPVRIYVKLIAFDLSSKCFA